MAFFGKRRRREGDSGVGSSQRKKWAGIFRFRSKTKKTTPVRSPSEVKGKQPRSEQPERPQKPETPQKLSGNEKPEEEPHHAVLGAPPSPSSSTSNSSLGDAGRENTDMAKEPPTVASEVLPKPPSTPPPVPDIRPDHGPKNSASEASPIPQIATVASLAPKVLKQPKLASNQKKRAATDLPHWWKGGKEDAHSYSTGSTSRVAKETVPTETEVAPSKSVHSPTPQLRQASNTSRIPQIATLAALAPKSLSKSKPKKNTHSRSSNRTSLSKVAKESPTGSEVVTSHSAPPPSPQVPPQASETTGSEVLTSNSSPPTSPQVPPQASETNRIPQIATLSALAPKIRLAGKGQKRRKNVPIPSPQVSQDLPSKAESISQIATLAAMAPKNLDNPKNKHQKRSIPQIATVGAMAPKLLNKPKQPTSKQEENCVPQIATLAAMAPKIHNKPKSDPQKSSIPQIATVGSVAPKLLKPAKSKLQENSVPQIATVATIAPKILNKPMLTSSEHMRRTDLPDWWKAGREEASSVRDSGAFKTSGRDLMPKEESAGSFVQGISSHSAPPTSEAPAKEAFTTKATPLVGTDARTATLKTEAHEQEARHGEKTQDEEPRCIPQIATIKDLGPKILRDPKLCAHTALKNTRPSTALPDWWKQDASEKVMNQRRNRGKLLSASWHGGSAPSSLKHEYGLFEKEITSVSLHSAEPAVSRRKSDVAKRVSFASSSSLELPPPELCEPTELPPHEPADAEEPATALNQEKAPSDAVELVKVSKGRSTVVDSLPPTAIEAETTSDQEKAPSEDVELVKGTVGLSTKVDSLPPSKSTDSSETVTTLTKEKALSEDDELVKVSQGLSTEVESLPPLEPTDFTEPATILNQEKAPSEGDVELFKERKRLPTEVESPGTTKSPANSSPLTTEDDCCESIVLESSFSDDAPKAKPADSSSGTLTVAEEGSGYLELSKQESPALSAKNILLIVIGGLVAAYACSGFLDQVPALQLIFF